MQFKTQTYSVDSFYEQRYLSIDILVHKSMDLHIAKPINKLDPNKVQVLQYKFDHTTKPIYFSIQEFYNDDKGYLYVNIFAYVSSDINSMKNTNSSNNKHSFKNSNSHLNIYYTSQSSSSVWRYLYPTIYFQYEKGYNYVSTTFINTHVQKYIYENKSSFSILNGLPIQKYYFYNKDFADNKFTFNMEKNTKMVIDRINDIKYVQKNVFFNVINKIFPLGLYIDELYICLEKLEKLVKRTELLGNKKYHNFEMRTFRKYKEFEDFNNPTSEELEILNNLYCLFLKYIYPEYNQDKFDQRKTLNLLKNVFNEIFLMYFEIAVDTNCDLFTYDINFGSSNLDTKCSILVKSVEITYKKEPGDKFIMYYTMYNCDFLKDKSMRTILYITPTNNNLTIFGLDEFYCVGGALINKIFEYKQQTFGIDEYVGHNPDTTKNYRFIGDFTNYDFLP